jgi:hypothetical protein
MTNHILLVRLFDCDFEAMEQLVDLFRRDPEAAANVAWRFLDEAGENGRHVPGGFCRQAVELLVQQKGLADFEHEVVRRWERSSTRFRENMCYDVFSYSGVLSNDLAMKLFWSVHSTLSDRRNIIWNLAVARKERGIADEQFVEMLESLAGVCGGEDVEKRVEFIARVKTVIASD